MARMFQSCFGFAHKPDKLYNTACLTRIAADTPFQVCELEALHELFVDLCSKGERSDRERFVLSRSTWANGCRVSERFFDLFDTDRDGFLNFEEFARGLAVFHPSTSRDVKTRFMFDFYDLQRKGFLVESDVRLFLARALPLGTSSNLEVIVKATFAEADINSDGMIDRDEWKVMVNKHEMILRPLTLEALKEITLAYPGFIFHVVDYNLESGADQR